jgi:uncharacterized membrane protein YphA (DoxX/SURF4 family)
MVPFSSCPEDALSLLLDCRAMRVAAVVRILTGALFVAEGLSKITGGFVRGEFAGSARRMATATFPFWKRFLEAVVLPHASVFAWLVALGELAVGLALLAGFLTRTAAAAGALLMLSIVLGAARPEAGAAWDDWITAGLSPKLALLLFALLAGTNSAAVWSVDSRRPRRAKPVRA